MGATAVKGGRKDIYIYTSKYNDIYTCIFFYIYTVIKTNNYPYISTYYLIIIKDNNLFIFA